MKPISLPISKRVARIPGFCLRSLALLLVSSAAWAQSNYATPYAITTIAGVSEGTADGTGSAARFFNPNGVAVDSSGNVYVADTRNDTIRKITSGGVVTTLAGTPGVYGSADGTGSAARFYNPYGVAVDSSGNVYVADSGNSTIRKITSGGVVTTLAGSAGARIGIGNGKLVGYADGIGSAARFNGPSGIAVDGSGNAYVADTSDATIRKIVISSGAVTTLAGNPGIAGSADGTGSAAEFNLPYGIAVDGSGNVYVSDITNETIRKITSAGVVTTLAGSTMTRGSADGTGSAARFNVPYGVAVDVSGNVYVADTENDTIRMITPAGVVSTMAGTAKAAGSVDGTYSAARFNGPTGVAVDSSGTVYVADTLNNTIRKVTPGGVVTALAGMASIGSTDGAGSAALFNGPQGIAVDVSGNAYVADTYNATIRKITSGGVVTTLAGIAGVTGSADGTGGAAQFNSPYGVAVDGPGNVYVADTGNNTVRKITPGGVVTTLAGSATHYGSADGTGSTAEFNSPEGIAADASGNLYVADTLSNTIRKVTPGGVVTTLAGTAGVAGSVDGTGKAAQFNSPLGIAVDGSGNVYVADNNDATIRKITPSGVVTTLAGTAPLGGGATGYADGTGSAAEFSYPEDVAVDGAGNVYVADWGNCAIRMVTPGGVVTTLAGDPLQVGSADGTGSTARFYNPAGIAADGSGNLYIADSGNNTIRYGRPATPTTRLPYTQTAWLTNLSVRSNAGTGSQTLIGGFVISGTGLKSVLIRGDGPALASFNVSGFLPDPVLTLFNSGNTALTSNSGWDGSAALSNVFVQVGAFALPVGSKDTAILSTLGAGDYTAQITSTSGDSGVALVEIYDADTGTPSSHVINLSARSAAGTGSQTLIAGFAIAGTGTETVLIRGVGPGLAQFNLSGLLAVPQLTLFDGSGKPIATNTGWGNSPTLGSSTVQASLSGATLATFSQVGAFSLQAGSADSALVATLPPGTYTAQVTGVNSATGVALVEIYEVPPSVIPLAQP